MIIKDHCRVFGLVILLAFSPVGKSRAADYSLTAEPSSPAPSLANTSQPEDWIDPDTGHRIVRLSRVPGINHVFYFHQNCFTASGDLMAFANIDAKGARRIFVVDLKTFACHSVSDRNYGGPFFQEVAPKSRQAFYLSGVNVCSANLDTAKNRVVATLPKEWTYGRGFTVNADETLLAGCASIGEQEVVAHGHFPDKGAMMEGVWSAKLPAVLYTIEIATGKIQVILKGNDWYGHVQFSPVDPGLLMFCHEGPWQKVQRIWTIRTDGSGLQNRYQPEQAGDTSGHEFWNPDGTSIWYDQPRVHHNALGETQLADNKQSRLPLENGLDWNVHYTISPDAKFFAGDGCANNGGPTGATNPWIRLITKTPENLLHEERLANLQKNDYKLEPNVHITPDGTWIVYQADISGVSQVYAVKVN